ncbi:MAG: AtpZ/AtpI family protein [Tissierellia bacterium]|nr:AtpZ/AtpI family protein [Tissierellia bacterium]
MKKHRYLEGVAQITQVGLNMIVPILLCTILGNWLDKKIGGKGIILIIFILLGVGASFYNLFRLEKKQR